MNKTCPSPFRAFFSFLHFLFLHMMEKLYAYGNISKDWYTFRKVGKALRDSIYRIHTLRPRISLLSNCLHLIIAIAFFLYSYITPYISLQFIKNKSRIFILYLVVTRKTPKYQTVATAQQLFLIVYLLAIL